MMIDPTANAAFIIFSSLSPLLIAFVKQSGFPRQVNALIALACYIVVGIVGAIVSGEPLTLENAVTLIAVATVVGSAAYNLIWNVIGTESATGIGNESDVITGESLDARLTEATSIVKA